MTDRFNFEQPLEELEAFIRSAGRFVEPSDDLRPRVLEAARDQRYQRRAQDRISRAAALVLALGIFLMLLRQSTDTTALQPLGLPRESGSLSANATALTDQSGSAWELVDSLTELRRRQAILFRLAL